MTAQMTIGEVNQKLKAANLPQITSHALKQEIGRLRPMDRIMAAIRSCDRDQGARAFLENLLTTAQRNLENRSSQGNAEDIEGAGDGSSGPADSEHEDDAPPPPQDYGTDMATSRPAPPDHQDDTGQRTARGQGPAPQGERQYLSHHVYGGKGALCFEADTTRSDAHTVSLDAAPTIAPRKYDWQNKTRVQMTIHELPFVTAVLMGLLPSCEYRNHGPDNNKGFSMQRQEGGKVFVRVFEGDKGAKAVPIEASDVFHVASLCLRQLMLNSPWLDTAGILATLRATVAVTAQPRRAA